MKKIVIKISDLCNYRRKNGNPYTLNSFDLAGAESNDYLFKKLQHKKLLKNIAFATCCTSLVILLILIIPSTKTYADMLQFKRFSKQSPLVFNKVMSVSRIYIDYVNKADIPHNFNLFMDMVCTCLDEAEKDIFIKASKGLDLHDILNLIFML